MNAPRDPNYIPVVLGASTVDGTPLPLQIDPVTGRILATIVAVGSIPSNVPTGNVKRDDNRIPVMAGASTVDNVTLLPLQVDVATGGLIVDYVNG